MVAARNKAGSHRISVNISCDGTDMEKGLSVYITNDSWAEAEAKAIKILRAEKKKL